jgi:hypothetical protein
MSDAVVSAAFYRASRNNETREAALISAVALLVADRQRLIAELSRVTQGGLPSLVIDGVRFEPTPFGLRETVAARSPSVPSDAGPSEPTDSGPSVPTDSSPAATVERDWFFTFGSGHSYHGESLERAYVRFHGTWLEARQKMVDAFGKAWSHQYPSEEEAGVGTYGLYELKLEAR